MSRRLSWLTRSSACCRLLDNVLRTLQLCSLDADDPRSSRFAPGEVPCIPASAAKVPCTTYPEKVLDAEMNTTNSPFWGACQVFLSRLSA